MTQTVYIFQAENLERFLIINKVVLYFVKVSSPGFKSYMKFLFVTI